MRILQGFMVGSVAIQCFSNSFVSPTRKSFAYCLRTPHTVKFVVL